MADDHIMPGTCTRKRPCPICGDSSPCLVRDNGDVECGEKGRTNGRRVLTAPRGWTMQGEIDGSQLALVLYVRTADPPEPRPPKYRDFDVDKRTEENERLARRIWERARPAGIDHARLRDYLKARGVLVDRLPGGKVPDQLAFCPDCEERDVKGEGWTRWPAMIGRIAILDRAADGKHKLVQTGLHRTFLARDGTPAKRAEADGNPKMMLGRCGGRAIWLTKKFPAGVAILVEGIEKGAAVLCSAPDAGVLVYLSASYLKSFELPEQLVCRGGPVHTVIYAVDLDRSRLGQGKPQDDFVHALREEVEVDKRGAEFMAGLPTSERWAWRNLTVQERKYPWLTMAVRKPVVDADSKMVQAGLLQTDGELVKGRKSVDWTEVLQAAGPEALAEMVLGGIDVAANRDKAAAAPASDPPAPIGTRSPATPSGEGSGGGGGTPWIGREEDELPIIEGGSLTRARRFLVEQCRLTGAGRFGLARWQGKWLIYDGRAYVVVEDERLRSIVWHWLDGFRAWKRNKAVRLDPTARAVEDVMRALAVDTAVVSETSMCWLDPVIGPAGEPMWGMASLVTRRGRSSPRPDPRSQIVFANGRLDLKRLVDRRLPVQERIRLEPHTPDLFTTTCLPFDLPVAELEALIAGRDRDEIYTRLSPKFYGWLADASDGDGKWENQCLMMLGDTISNDRSIEKIFCPVGLRRGGKGILEDAIAAILGEENVGAINSSNLSDRFGLSHLVGKAVAIMPDAHLDRIAQDSGAVEILKTLSGQGRIPIRDLYQPARTHKLGCRVWIFCNQEPELRDDSAALAGRFVWLPITKSYQGKEDESIKASVPGEAPGIMLLALEGAIRLWSQARRHIEMCGMGQEIYDAFEEDSAPLKKFAGTWLVYERVGQLPKHQRLAPEKLYHAYCVFCEVEEKRHPLGYRKFCRNIRWHLQPFGYDQIPEPDPRDPSKEIRPRTVAGWHVSEEKADLWAKHKDAEPNPQPPTRMPSGRLWKPD